MPCGISRITPAICNRSPFVLFWSNLDSENPDIGTRNDSENTCFGTLEVKTAFWLDTRMLLKIS